MRAFLLLACPVDVPQPFGSGQGGLSDGQAADTGLVLLIFVPRAAHSHDLCHSARPRPPSTDGVTSERRGLEPAAEAPADGCRERSQPLRYAIARSAACSIGPLGNGNPVAAEPERASCGYSGLTRRGREDDPHGALRAVGH
jgi:hypothetical protein